MLMWRGAEMAVTLGDPGGMLARLRMRANVKQGAVAAKMGVDQSRISRIETGELTPTPSEVQAYLSALGTSEASSYIRHLENDWRFLELPTPENPELDVIWEAEEQLQRLDGFEQAKNPPGPVRAELDMHRESLLRAAGFLHLLEHDIAFVGPVGVGKTTALCLAEGLTLTDPATGLESRVVLETGGGRITLCEVQVKSGPAWGVLVQPFPDDEVYRLVNDLCEGLLDRVAPDSPEATQKGVPREIDRALRNMADLPRSRRKTPDGARVLQDPAAELASKLGALDALRSEFASRLQLWKRTTRELWYDQEGRVPPERWLCDVFGKINKGQLPGVSLPQRIDILIPRTLLRQSTFKVSVVDTRGVDETAIRADLRTRLDDARTVTCLCSPFNSAPDPGTQSFLEHSIETGLARAVSERVALLILPRPGEAQAMRDDAGEPVGTDDEGYELKLDQIQAVLRRLGVEEIPVLFFNAVSDDPSRLSEELLDLVTRMRATHVSRIRSVRTALDQLFTDYEIQSAELTRRRVVEQMSRYVELNKRLPAALNPVHDLLLREMRRTHARTLWATTRRQGGWYNLDVYSYLGAGAAREATCRSQKFFDGLEFWVTPMLEDEELKAAHPFLREVLVNVGRWRELFVEASHAAGKETFRPALQDDLALWLACEGRWGGGLGYREDVVDTFRDWFEASERKALHRAVEARMQNAWRNQVIRPLKGVFSGPMD
jgi:transcriptional regulator with XRE-family HTH domain